VKVGLTSCTKFDDFFLAIGTAIGNSFGMKSMYAFPTYK